MHTRTLKKLALALTFWLAVYSASLRAQILGPDTITGSNATFEIDGNGVLWETGTGNLGLSLTFLTLDALGVVDSFSLILFQHYFIKGATVTEYET